MKAITPAVIAVAGTGDGRDSGMAEESSLAVATFAGEAASGASRTAGNTFSYQFN